MTFSIQRLFAPLLILVPVLVLAACGGTDTTSTDGATAEKGATLVKDNGCAGCHTPPSGALLSGQEGSSIAGPNITPDKDTGIGSWTDAQITAALRDGVDDDGKTLCSAMPKFSALSAEETASIVLYLKSIPAVKRGLPEPTCQ